MVPLRRRLLAEFIGTAALIFVGAGAAALGIGGLAGAAFAHGFVVLGLIFAIGSVSGCHINPAVTAGLWTAGVIETGDAIAYVAAQFAGGLCGALLLAFCLGGTSTGLGATVLAVQLPLGDEVITISALQGLVLEILGTFWLVFVVLATAVAGRAGALAPVAIGLTLTSLIFFIGPLTGASLNPARTLGPAVVAVNFADIWLFFVGPVVGGVLAALAHKALSVDGDAKP